MRRALAVALTVAAASAHAEHEDDASLDTYLSASDSNWADVARDEFGMDVLSLQSTARPCPYTWNRDLSEGAQGTEVQALQQFLNQNSLTRVAASGPGSPGQETTFYGPATAAAVSRFQERFRSEILGTMAPTGYFGTKSRTKANSMCGGSSPAPSPSPTPSPSPSTGSFNFAPWQKAERCTGGPTPGAQALAEWIKRIVPIGSNWGIYNCRNIANSASMSCHAEGRALDWGIPMVNGRGNPAGYEAIRRLGANGRALGVQFMAFDMKGWSASSPSGSPLKATSSATLAHYDHIHIELTRDAAQTLTLQRLIQIAG